MVGFSKNPGLEKLHYDKQICRSLAVDHGVWCLKALREGWRAWGTIWGAIEWICCNYLSMYISIHLYTDTNREICVFMCMCIYNTVWGSCRACSCGLSNLLFFKRDTDRTYLSTQTCSLISKNGASLCWNSIQVAPSFQTSKKAHCELIFFHVCYKLEGWSTACSDIKKRIWLSSVCVLFCLCLLLIHMYIHFV